MPANKKYLTRSPLQRWLKITAGFFGGYAVTVSFFVMLTYFFDREDVLMTGALFGYLLWAVLLLLSFLARSGGKMWLLYILLTALFFLPHLLHTELL